MEDIEILELFFHRSETAVTALLRQCGRTPGRLAHNLLSCEEDVEECINDAAKEAWDTIPPEMPRSLLAYTCILVRRRAVERIRYRSAGRQEEAETIRMELEESLVSTGDAGDSLDVRELQAYLNDFLASLTPENRCLVIKRYFYCESLRRIGTEIAGRAFCRRMRRGNENAWEENHKAWDLVCGDGRNTGRLHCSGGACSTTAAASPVWGCFGGMPGAVDWHWFGMYNAAAQQRRRCSIASLFCGTGRLILTGCRWMI